MPGTEVPHRVYFEAIGSDSKRLVTVSTEGSVRIWSVEMGELLGPALDFGGRNENDQVSFWATEVEISPDESSICVAGSPGGPRLWTIPPPFRDDVKDTSLWLQVLTWTEMDAHGVLGRLYRATWQARRDQLSGNADQ